MRISQLYHMISEIERVSRQQAKEKFAQAVRRNERDMAKCAKKLANKLMWNLTYGSLAGSGIEYNSDVLQLTKQFADLTTREHELADEIGTESETIAREILAGKGIRITVETDND